MIKLETTTKDGDKVLAHTIVKKLSISIDELVEYAKEINLKVKSAQHILSLDEANQLVSYIQKQKQKLEFNSDDWKSCTNIDNYKNLIKFIDNTLYIIDTQITQNSDRRIRLINEYP